MTIKLDDDTTKELQRQARLELARRYGKAGDVLKWGKILFPEKFEFPFCQSMHQYFVDTMYEEFTCTEAPRGFAKTTIGCFLIPLFLACEHPEMYRHYMNVQSTSTKAIAINISIRHEFEYNKDLIEIYGYLVDDKKWTEKQFVLKKTDTRPSIVFTAVGAGESIRGINYDNMRPDYIPVDDLYDENHIYNVEATKKVNQWFWSTLYPARASTKKNCVHLQGTAINKVDLMCDLKEKEKDLKTISIKFKTFQAIIDDSKHEVLWKEFKPYEILMDEKTLMGTRAFNRERQNVRGSNEESIIKESYIRYYDEIPAGKKIVSKVVTCDPSVGEKLLNDYSGYAAIYKAEIPDAPGILDYYIADLINEHLSQNLRILTLENFAERHQAIEVLIEGIAGFKDFALEAKRRTDLNIKIIDHVKDKISNLEAESPKFENGRVWIKKSIPIKLRNMLVEQLIDNYPKHDDLRDAVLLGIKSKKNPVSIF